MSILKRFSDIMSANINALLDKAEDPVKMVDQIMRNLNDDLMEVKSETAAIMAEESRSKRELDECTQQVNKMVEYAKRAVAAGSDDDARKFLGKKVELTEELNALQTKYNAAKANSVKMKEMHTKITNQIQELNERKNTIKAKMATAKMQEKVNKLGSSVSGAKNSMDAFARMEEKANSMLDQANAMAELNTEPVNEVDDLMSKYDTNTSAVDDELAALKGGSNSEIDQMLEDLKNN